MVTLRYHCETDMIRKAFRPRKQGRLMNQVDHDCTDILAVRILLMLHCNILSWRLALFEGIVVLNVTARLVEGGVVD